MKIKRWLRDGHDGLAECCEDTEELLEVAGNRLDDAQSWDIVGEVVFEGDDGKIYVGSVEFVIEEANPKYVQDLEDEEDDG